MSKCFTDYERALAAYIGRRVEERRKQMRMTQRELASAIGIKSYQKMYRYESGENMFPAVRLAAIAIALRVPMDWFIQGFDFQKDAIYAITKQP